MKREIYLKQPLPWLCRHAYLFVYHLLMHYKCINLYISISIILGDEERVIYHYHFLGWPDHGTPEDPGSVLNFLHDVKLKQVEKRQKQGLIKT